MGDSWSDIILEVEIFIAPSQNHAYLIYFIFYNPPRAYLSKLKTFIAIEGGAGTSSALGRVRQGRLQGLSSRCTGQDTSCSLGEWVSQLSVSWSIQNIACCLQCIDSEDTEPEMLALCVNACIPLVLLSVVLIDDRPHCCNFEAAKSVSTLPSHQECQHTSLTSRVSQHFPHILQH